ncbi:MAG: protein-S-isoprenylcysteine O-methyltransferase Ste14 [Brevundimonas sp.]|jgi:protein-S-isoprenylcysteine O-methyltransferase Ste14|uniref:hypothetical protein n=1 Tax=Brevundimonas sp. TaxID=1871086 RepID=UPI0039E5AD8E
MQWAAWMLGAVYGLAGLAGWRRARMNAFMDRALAGITLKPVPQVERVVGAWLHLDALLLAAAALGLALSSRWGALTAVLVVIEQGVFCLWAQRFYPARHAADVQSREAVLVVIGFYAALGVLAVGLWWMGVLS